ncbi:histone-lysine N-methyltransferase, H3 lysine-79 specific [Parathielavia appendiculata]|uniref:Histone-lysine N-methyltransferase, H3 lysine-79 specific n=1 Tax=Parathielavia appendiculata TaxID=2587402 RepID=A0AAN6Z3U1_9PEZI|nr:histone-lysine N-methyltransferase, H3 lysine-79 specific [Parathielavia appendiculata]
MSIFNQKSKFKVKTEVRKVKQAVEPAPLKKPAGVANASRPSLSVPGSTRASPIPSSLHAKRLYSSSSPESKSSLSQSRKRRGPANSRSPATASPAPALSDSEPGSDDEDDWRDRVDPSKRRKRAHTEDPDRRLRHPSLWSGQGEEDKPGIVHAADVASLADRCQPVMYLTPDEVVVRLRYPGAKYPERYELVWGKDKIDGALDIMKVVKLVASTYLTDQEAKPFLDQDNGIYRRLEKSKNTKDGKGFKEALTEYNDQLLALQMKGVIAKNIDAMRGIPRELVDFILDQVYDRTVAPKVELLAKYENGTDNVYGELLHPFISDIFDRTKLSSDMVFVDLGSGVGNVALHAALERGCESWGCEMMENACNLAEAQNKEFTARCRLWGIAPGKVHLERGDFRKNERTLAALKRADVVLVNNQAFTSQLNDHLVNMFLDLKIGCKIVSLKTFVHDNKIAENDVASSILEVEHLTYPAEHVSWTAAPGTFCISTRK